MAAAARDGLRRGHGRLVPAGAELRRPGGRRVRGVRRGGVLQGAGRAERFLTRMLPAPFVKHFTPGLSFLARISKAN